MRINCLLFFEKKNPEGTKYNEIGIPNHYDLNWIVVFRDKKINEEDFEKILTVFLLMLAL